MLEPEAEGYDFSEGLPRDAVAERLEFATMHALMDEARVELE